MFEFKIFYWEIRFQTKYSIVFSTALEGYDHGKNIHVQNQIQG